MSQLINELISNRAVCRTAPATPGLSKKKKCVRGQGEVHQGSKRCELGAKEKCVMVKG